MNEHAIKKGHILILLFVFLSFGMNDGANAKKMYRWVDENGKTVLSDKVPPEQSYLRREKLSEKGAVVEITEKAKSKEEIALDRRLQALRKAQEEIIAKQRVNDKVLLSAFRNLDDMLDALDKKIHAMDSQLTLLESNKTVAEGELEAFLRQAALIERNGEKIPGHLTKKIGNAKEHIKKTEKEIENQKIAKRNARVAFEADIERYKFLTQSNNEAPEAVSDKSAEKRAAVELGLFLCGNRDQCDQAWKIAHEFVGKFSTTSADIDNDKLLMTAEPVADTDLSLSISKIDLGNNQQQLFLDIRCRQSSLGAEFCLSERVRNIRTSFRSFIEQRIENTAK